MSTILRRLPASYYTAGATVGYFYPHNTPPLTDEEPRIGYRLGDYDDISIQVNVADGMKISSKEDNIPTVVVDEPGEISVVVSGTFKQMSPLIRAASLMGNMGVRQQDMQTGVTKQLGAAGAYQLGGHVAIANLVATLENGDEALSEIHYTVDLISGQIETFVDGISVVYDVTPLSTGFMTGIGSSQGIRGALWLRSVNRQGVRSLIKIHDVPLRPSGARQLGSNGVDPGAIALQGTALPVAGRPVGYEIGYEQDITEETIGGI